MDCWFITVFNYQFEFFLLEFNFSLRAYGIFNFATADTWRWTADELFNKRILVKLCVP